MNASVNLSLSAPNRIKINPGILGLVLVFICTPLFFFRLNTYPAPWYDEGYTIQVSRLLLDEGIYGTYNGPEGYRPFDPTISSGPTIVLPVTLSFKMFGVGITQARFIAVLYAMVAIYGFYICAWHIYGSKSALLSVVFLLIIPLISRASPVSFILVGRQVLGEVPAFAYAVLGLFLWFRNWDRNSWLLSILSGILLGLGILSKPQIVFGLFPGLIFIALARSIQNRSKIGQNIAPLVIMVMVFGLWMLIQQMGTIDQIRVESRGLFWEAARLHFFTGLFGSNLTNGAWGLTAVMILTSLLTYGKAISQSKKIGMTNRLWAEVTLASIIFCTAIWFSLFSVGFERYAFLGITLSMLLMGNIARSLLSWFINKLSARNTSPVEPITTTLSVILFIGVFALNSFNIVRNANPEDDLQRAVDFIDQNIPKDATVESLELELTTVAPKREYHRANYRYMYDVIQQYGHERRPFDLGYNVLEVDPDFLSIGFMADWTHLYDPDTVKSNFSEIARFGQYQIFQRVRKTTEG
jgi:4-amino-4-deoxy-L-arabinose transferase-like glycosyltransferase